MPEEKKDNMGIYDVLLIINIIQGLAMEIYQQYKAGNPAPMTKEEWEEIAPKLIEQRKKAVADALSI